MVKLFYLFWKKSVDKAIFLYINISRGYVYMCIMNIFKKKDETHKKLNIRAKDIFFILIKQDRVLREIHELRRLIMATKQEVLDAIAAEKTQVAAALDELAAQIQTLKDQIAAGTPVTAADLDDIVSAVNDIFIPTPPVEPIV
jgi:hypothetical protein